MRRLPKPYTEAELEALYAEAFWSPLVGATMRLLHATGMRSAEALSLTVEQAHTWPGPGRRGRNSHAIRIIGKGDKERVVLLNATALEAAATLAEGRSSGRLIPWSDRGLRYVIAECGKRAGVHAHPHRFRHTCATELAEAGVPIEVVADMLGHSSIDVTRIYYESSVTRRAEAERQRRRFWRRGRRRHGIAA